MTHQGLHRVACGWTWGSSHFDSPLLTYKNQAVEACMKLCGLRMCYLFSLVWQTFDPADSYKKELAEKPQWTMCPTGDSNEKTMSWTESLFHPLFQKIPFIISLCFEIYILTINYVQFWSWTNFESLILVNIYTYIQYIKIFLRQLFFFNWTWDFCQ